MAIRNYPIVKFNGGNGAVLCNNCGVIVYAGHTIPDDIHAAMIGNEGMLEKLPPVFCSEKCERMFNLYNELENGSNVY